MNFKYIDTLDDQTQMGMIDYKAYEDHIYKYVILRQQPQTKFHDHTLESAFSEFDEVLVKYVSEIRLAYTVNNFRDQEWFMSGIKEAKLIHGRWLTEETYRIVQEKYENVVELSIELLEQSKKLTKTIHEVVPDFFMET